MAYCTKCGKELAEGEQCTCRQDGVLEHIKQFFGGRFNRPEYAGIFERGKYIVPDCITADEGEISVKQYDLAILRSRILGQRAEGRLMITNKRVVFRAPGLSVKGSTLIQHEVSLDEVSGIEIQNNNRISFLNILGGLLVALFFMDEAERVFTQIYNNASVAALILAVGLFLGSVTFFFLLRKWYWAKLSLLSISMGSVLGTASVKLSVLDIVTGFKTFTFHNALIFILGVFWVLALARVICVPDLIFTVKTGAGEAFAIRRREWGSLFKQPQVHSGFSEVLPVGGDSRTLAREIGAIISDLQTMGDLAVQKWKEK